MGTIDTDYIVLDVPHLGEPRAYAGYGREMYLHHTYQAADFSGQTVYEKTTARELAECFGVAPDDSAEEFDDADATWIADLAAAHGWDTPLYRADWMLAEGEYSAEPVDEVEAAEAYNGHDLSGYYLITSAEECRAVLGLLTSDRAPRIGNCGPVRAAWALRREAQRIGWVEADTAEGEEEE